MEGLPVKIGTDGDKRIVGQTMLYLTYRRHRTILILRFLNCRMLDTDNNDSYVIVAFLSCVKVWSYWVNDSFEINI